MKIRINIYNLIIGLVLCLFILSESISSFAFLDKWHVKHFVLLGLIGIMAMKNAPKLWNAFFHIKELSIMTIMIISITFISLMLQFWNNNIQLYLFAQIYYLITPLLFISLLYIDNKPKNIDFLMKFLLFSMFFVYIVNALKIGTLSLNNFLANFNIYNLFVKSESTVIEIGMVSSCCTMIEIYFLSKKNYKYALLSVFGVILGYKRLCVLISILLFVCYPLYRNFKVGRKLILFSILIFVLLPFLTQMICTDEFAEFFYNKFGINFDYFTKTRFSIINTVIDQNIQPNGLGTITNFLEIRGANDQTNMHNDLLMVYLDCTFIGSLIFTWAYFKITKGHIYSYLIILFMFSQMFVTHCIGRGTVLFWLLGYLLIFNFNRTKISCSGVYLCNKQLSHL